MEKEKEKESLCMYVSLRLCLFEGRDGGGELKGGFDRSCSRSCL